MLFTCKVFNCDLVCCKNQVHFIVNTVTLLKDKFLSPVNAQEQDWGGGGGGGGGELLVVLLSYQFTAKVTF